jgi:hypothetical protein
MATSIYPINSLNNSLMECMETMKGRPGIATVMLTAFTALYILLDCEDRRILKKKKNH